MTLPDKINQKQLESIHRQRSLINKTLGSIIGVSIVASLGYGLIDIEQKKNARLNDLVYNAPIMQADYTHPERGFWNFYMNENVEHSQGVWNRYLDKVYQLNSGIESGKYNDKSIKLPDLDRDGKVSSKH